MLKKRKLHCLEKRCHSFYSYVSDNFASDIVIFGMLYRNGPSTWVIKYFSCLFGNAVVPTWITQSSQQRFVSGVVVCQLVCRLAVDILNIIFSHALSLPKKTGFSCPFGRVLLENGRVLNAKWTKSIQLEFF